MKLKILFDNIPNKCLESNFRNASQNNEVWVIQANREYYC